MILHHDSNKHAKTALNTTLYYFIAYFILKILLIHLAVL